MVVGAVYYGFLFGYVMSAFQMLDGGRYFAMETKSNEPRGGCNSTSYKLSSSPHNYDDNG
jgi:hypothetical protein